MKTAGIALLVLTVLSNGWHAVSVASAACPNCVYQQCISEEHCLYGCKRGYWGGRCRNFCTQNGCPANKECYRNPVTINGIEKYNCTLCPVGYYRGNTQASFSSCSEVCPNNCVTCSASHECHECKAPYYNHGEERDCSTRCPEKCATCLSLALCTKCNPPYYSAGNVTDCSLIICPDHCKDCTTERCLKCEDGYFDVNTSCSEVCPSNCLSCSSKEKCDQCRPKYYNGNNLDDPAYPHLENCTWRCKDTCAECTSFNSCQTCVKGSYGSVCEKQCSIGCTNNTCNKNTGTCDCRDSYFGDKCCVRSRYCKTCSSTEQCIECQAGHYGSHCNQSCSKNCLNGCNMESGECNDCVMNTYGKFCENNCSAGCSDIQAGTTLCNTSTGRCLHRCRVGFYGEKCDYICSETCEDGCDIDSGICNLCIPNTHGMYCENNCSLGCLNDSLSESNCNSSTGICLSGCKSGYFSEFCDKTCSQACRNGCDSATGYCLSCVKDTYGLYCNKTCSENCVSENNNQTKCNETDGTCLHGCNEGHYGEQCKDDCSENCAGKVCNRTSGECLHGCQGPFQGKLCSKALPLGDDNKNLGQAIGSGVAVGIICLALLTGVVILLVKRSRKKTKSDTTALVAHFSPDIADTNSETVGKNLVVDSSATLRDSSASVSIGGFPQYEHIEETEYVNTELQSYANATLKIRVSSFYNYTMEHSFDFFEGEFKRLPKDLIKPYACAKKKENAKKSRYTGIYPYDDSRVKIKEDPNFFINACYIDGYRQEKAYIASLGPTKKATENFSLFWKMVWHEQSDIIVMLTNLRETTGTKCEQYWPEVGESLPYGDVTVACHSEEAFAEHVVRIFTAMKKKTKRTVTQLHFTAWPDQGVPDSVVSLVEFWQRVRAAPRLTKGPVIVHCSAGIGRTGTYIALDRLTLEGKAEGSVNVYGCVSDMRQQRVNMVQTVEQYIYLHKALAYTLTFESQEIMIDSLKDSQTLQKADVQPLFQELSKELGDETNEDIEARVRNKSYTNKNRKGADIPGDRHRPRLYLSRTSADLDYVNAVYVNSYRYKDNFVVAQTPLPSTVEDFLCLIYQEDCFCIVSLDDVTTQAKNVGKYLPTDDHQVTAGQFIVTATESHSSRYYNESQVILTTNMKNQPKKTITLYQYTGWKQEKPSPESISDFVEFVTTVKGEAEKLSTGRSSPILIHCTNGAERSGLFCVVAVLSERVQYEGRVCLSNTVRQIRSRRKTAVPNKHQLQFCHQCVAAFMDVNCMYTNIAAAQNQNQ